jgi:hypothetical protein
VPLNTAHRLTLSVHVICSTLPLKLSLWHRSYYSCYGDSRLACSGVDVIQTYWINKTRNRFVGTIAFLKSSFMLPCSFCLDVGRYQWKTGARRCGDVSAKGHGFCIPSSMRKSHVWSEGWRALGVSRLSRGSWRSSCRELRARVLLVGRICRETPSHSSFATE